MEPKTCDEGPEVYPFRHGGEPGEKGPSIRRASLGAPVASVEEMVADPYRVESGRFGRPGHGDVLGPAHVAFDFRKLDPDAQRSHHGRQSMGLREKMWP